MIARIAVAAVLLVTTGELQAQNKPFTVVVANQQSASSTVLTSDSAKTRHLPVGEGPHEAAIAPDGRTAVVTVYGARVPGNQLAVIDLVRDTVLRIIDLGTYTRPHGVAYLSVKPLRVAVTSETTQNVVIVDLDSARVIAAISTGARGSHMVAVTADKKHAYTGNIGSGSVSEIDLVNRTLVKSVEVPPKPEGIAVTPNGAEVWVGSNETGAVTIIDTKLGQITHTITGARFPYRLSPSPDGKLMAIVDAMGNKVYLADVATHAFVANVELASPLGAAFSPDGKFVFVTQEGGSVAMIEVAGARVKRTFAVQASPDGIGVR